MPAGFCSATSEAARLEQVHTELQQEIERDARKVVKLGSFYAASSVHLQPHVYLATELFRSPVKRDPSEHLKIVAMPFDKAYNLILSGKIITTSHTVFSFFLAKEKLR